MKRKYNILKKEGFQIYTVLILAGVLFFAPFGSITAESDILSDEKFIGNAENSDNEMINVALGEDNEYYNPEKSDKVEDNNIKTIGSSENLILSNTAQNSALDEDEILPNENAPKEEPQAAQELKTGENIIPVELNTIVRDSLPSIISTNIYTFTVPERGVFIYSFNHVENTNKDCLWQIIFYEEYSPDGTGNTKAYRELNTVTYEKTGAGAKSVALGILPGNYRVAVKCVSGYVSGKYDIAFGFAKDNSYEIENNNTSSRYTELPLNKKLNGSASLYSDDSKDVDWYMFNVTDTGYCVLYFEHAKATEATTSSSAFIVTVTDMEGNEFYYGNSLMDTTSLNSGIMGLSPGYYLVKVESRIYTSETYSLTVSFNSDDAIEKEPNESEENATPLVMNRETVGALTQRNGKSDRDYYTFTMAKDGFISLSFVHEALSDDKDGWNVNIFNSKGETAFSSVSKWNQATLQTPYIGLAAGTYYIKIDSDNLYHSSIVYRLTLFIEENSAWETEPNNTQETADLIKDNSPVSGTLIENGVDFDKDYFVFTAEKDGSMVITFTHDKLTGADKEGWVISLLNEQGETVKKVNSKWDQETASMTVDGLKAGKYYILVETGLYFNSSRYVLTATLK